MLVSVCRLQHSPAPLGNCPISVPPLRLWNNSLTLQFLSSPRFPALPLSSLTADTLLPPGESTRSKKNPSPVYGCTHSRALDPGTSLLNLQTSLDHSGSELCSALLVFHPRERMPLKGEKKWNDMISERQRAQDKNSSCYLRSI